MSTIYKCPICQQLLLLGTTYVTCSHCNHEDDIQVYHGHELSAEDIYLAIHLLNELIHDEDDTWQFLNAWETQGKSEYKQFFQRINKYLDNADELPQFKSTIPDVNLDIS